jgi:hypothetical protein
MQNERPDPNGIDQALIQPCSELPSPSAKNKSTHLLWKKNLILLYGECRARHNSLVEVVGDKKGAE